MHTALVPAAMAAGACAAAGLGLVLEWAMPAGQLAASGWRIVLVLSLLCNGVCGYLRGWVLQQPEAGMTAADTVDRANIHMGQIIR